MRRRSRSIQHRCRLAQLDRRTHSPSQRLVERRRHLRGDGGAARRSVLSSSGSLTGTPTAGGTFNFTVTATDSSTGTGPYTGSRAYTLTINAPTITVNPASLPAGTVGSAYSQSITATGGTAPHTFAVTAGTLPAGLSLSSSGSLTGTPTAGGTFNFTVTNRQLDGHRALYGVARLHADDQCADDHGQSSIAAGWHSWIGVLTVHHSDWWNGAAHLRGDGGNASGGAQFILERIPHRYAHGRRHI